jgi:hypothetical protein
MARDVEHGGRLERMGVSGAVRRSRGGRSSGGLRWRAVGRGGGPRFESVCEAQLRGRSTGILPGASLEERAQNVRGAGAGTGIAPAVQPRAQMVVSPSRMAYLVSSAML